MQILHTADLHREADEAKTVEAFEAVIERAAAKEVDLLTMGGDIVEIPEDATHLIGTVRRGCLGNPFDVVAISGNHDAHIF